jgi:hypothetical protein
VLSTSTEDTKESFNLVYKSKVEISIRIRNNKYLKFADFTIRCQSRCGFETEIDKLIKGKGSIYLYAWKTLNNEKFESWILVDINKIRWMFSECTVGIRRNEDGTAFKPYSIASIAANDALINSFNLPKHCLPPEEKQLSIFQL